MARRNFNSLTDNVLRGRTRVDGSASHMEFDFDAPWTGLLAAGGVNSPPIVLNASGRVPERVLGASYVLRSSSSLAVGLPTAKVRRHLQFVVGTAPAAGMSHVLTVHPDDSGGMRGVVGVLRTVPPGLAASGRGTATFGPNASVGDRIFLMSDGVNWIVGGFVERDGALAFS